MSIKPVSDIVLDVARAADPARAAAAAARLESSQQGSGSGFSTMLAAKISSATNAAQSESGSRPPPTGSTSVGTSTAGHARTNAYRGLDQLVLQRLVETMLPKDADEIFGHGSAGDIWRSMLAEQLAAQLAKTVGLGRVEPARAAAGSIGPVGQTDRGARAIPFDGSPLEQHS